MTQEEHYEMIEKFDASIDRSFKELEVSELRLRFIEQVMEDIRNNKLTDRDEVAALLESIRNAQKDDITYCYHCGRYFFWYDVDPYGWCENCIKEVEYV